VATTFTEGIKAWYADNTVTGGSTRFMRTWDYLATNSYKDTVPTWTYYEREGIRFYPKIRITRYGNAASTLLLCRGRVVWDTLITGVTPKSFTWGLILNRPL
jgi:hypothetical protein